MPRVIEYIVVVDPMPRARAMAASIATPGVLLSIRRPSRRSDIIREPGTGNREQKQRNREQKNLGMLSLREMSFPRFRSLKEPRDESADLSSQFPVPCSRLPPVSAI